MRLSIHCVIKLCACVRYVGMFACFNGVLTYMEFIGFCNRCGCQHGRTTPLLPVAVARALARWNATIIKLW